MNERPIKNKKRIISRKKEQEGIGCRGGGRQGAEGALERTRRMREGLIKSSIRMESVNPCEKFNPETAFSERGLTPQ